MNEWVNILMNEKKSVDLEGVDHSVERRPDRRPQSQNGFPVVPGSKSVMCTRQKQENQEKDNMIHHP